MSPWAGPPVSSAASPRGSPPGWMWGQMLGTDLPPQGAGTPCPCCSGVSTGVATMLNAQSSLKHICCLFWFGFVVLTHFSCWVCPPRALQTSPSARGPCYSGTFPPGRFPPPLVSLAAPWSKSHGFWKTGTVCIQCVPCPAPSRSPLFDVPTHLWSVTR